MRKTLIISFFLFVFGVLLLTRLDYLINFEFYQFGLKFSKNWYATYSFLYFAMFQFLIIILALYSHSWRFLIIGETFTLSSTQDLIYFALWQGSFPTTSWTWLWYNPTTLNQIFLCAISVSVAVLIPPLVRILKFRIAIPKRGF